MREFVHTTLLEVHSFRTGALCEFNLRSSSFVLRHCTQHLSARGLGIIVPSAAVNVSPCWVASGAGIVTYRAILSSLA